MTLCTRQNRIDSTPDYQRPPVWRTKQKQLLIDSILREYDIPKLYWRKVDRDDGVEYEVIDGQQRLRAIWEYRSGGFGLPTDAEPVNGKDCAGMRYSDLDIELSTNFDSFSVDVVIVEEAIQTDQEDEIRDMFMRLQNGTTLKAQERRNAMPGQMRDFVKKLATHPFFEHCKFRNTRYTYDHVAAQIICLEMEGGPTNVRDSDLTRLYAKHTTFDENGKISRKVRKVLDYLLKVFPEHTGELERYNVIALYCLASALIERFVYAGTEIQLHDWFIQFEKDRRANESADEDHQDYQLVEYRRLTSQSTDSKESIRARLEFLEKRFFLEFPDIELKDSKRDFTAEQRLAIYRRDDGKCQIGIHCDGGKLPWNEWHADHIVAHAKGGKTIVKNGQVSCPACNLAKSSA